MHMQDDFRFMRRALFLAGRGQYHVRPNPMVGAVLVKNGKIIGEGWHEYYGGPHAEVEAFNHCTEDPEGAVLYVTLEPCAHYGKTPPCTELIISKKISRVVAAMEDPNPLVSGRGITRLKEAGIQVQCGLLERESRRLNEIFIKYIVKKIPFVIYKSAVSMDGKCACATGDSQWISGEESRRRSHERRGSYAGIMTGIGTVLADNPRLTGRTEGHDEPVRIIADGNLSVPLESRILHETGKNIFLITEAAAQKKKGEVKQLGAELIETPISQGGVDLAYAMKELGSRGIDSILLEGGPTLAAGAFTAGIIDKVEFYVAPLIVGGTRAPGPVGGEGALTVSRGIRLKDISWEMIGSDALVTAYVEKE